MTGGSRAPRGGPRAAFAACGLLLALNLLGLAAVSHQRELDSFGVVSGLPDPALAPRPATRLGVNVALEQYANPAAALDDLGAFHWLRQTFPWEQIEPEAGRYDWAAWDRLVAQATARDHELIAVLNYAPAWARAPRRTRT